MQSKRINVNKYVYSLILKMRGLLQSLYRLRCVGEGRGLYAKLSPTIYKPSFPAVYDPKICLNKNKIKRRQSLITYFLQMWQKCSQKYYQANTFFLTRGAARGAPKSYTSNILVNKLF